MASHLCFQSFSSLQVFSAASQIVWDWYDKWTIGNLNSMINGTQETHWGESEIGYCSFYYKNYPGLEKVCKIEFLKIVGYNI